MAKQTVKRARAGSRVVPAVVQERVEQLRGVVRRADRELRRMQKQVDARRRRIEKRAQHELQRIQKQIQRQPIVKRAEALRADAGGRLERGVHALVGSLPIATRADVERIDRKVSALSRKIREIEKAQGVGESAVA
jgi:hypothetical protein